MIDFTKEELEDLRNSLGVWIRSNNANPQSIFQLRNKVQSMIDSYYSYCSHEEKVIGCDPTTNEGICVYCEDCKKIIGKVY